MEIQGNRLTSRGRLEAVSFEVVDGKIQSERLYQSASADLPLLLPGFIDIHVHGGGGADTMDATHEAFEQIVRTHARHGTTGLLLTTVTESAENIENVIQTAKGYMQTQQEAGPTVGAAVLGVHLEGPFIHPQRAGAQRPDRIMEPSPTLAERWFSSGVVKVMTLAPERPHAAEVAKVANRHGVLTSIGHTTATYEDAAAAAEAGFQHVTHLCNAMSPLLHRAVGPIGYLVSDERMTGDLICDGIHIDGPMVKTLVRAIGVERLMLITDAIGAADMPDGQYELGGLPVTLARGVCRLEDGTLAGSVLTMERAFHTVQKLAGVTPAEAQSMASSNPAKRLHLSSKGRLAPGYDADIVMLNTSGEVIQTIVAGTTVYKAAE